MSAWIARRLARALLRRDPRVMIEIQMDTAGERWMLTVEHARDASPLAVARALRELADALASTVN